MDVQRESALWLDGGEVSSVGVCVVGALQDSRKDVISYDVATHGFEALQLYCELVAGIEQRSLPEVSGDEVPRGLAADVFRSWAGNYSEPVTPKY